MRVVVCVKQVPESTHIKIDPATNRVVREGVPLITNPFDVYAIEEAVRLKEKYKVRSCAITMGPSQAENVLREALSLGIDEAVHLCDKALSGSDTLVTSFVLAKAIKKIGNVELIICGRQALDGDTAQVGPGIAAHLDIPQVTCVKKIDSLNFEEKVMRVERLVEEGYEVLEVKLPALITVVRGINEPRIPSFREKLRAKKQSIPVWTCKDLEIKESEVGLGGSPTQVVELFTVSFEKQGVIWEGNGEEVVDRLVEKLKEQLL